MSVATRSPTSSARATDPVLADLVEQFLERLQAGEALDPTGFAAAHPEHAEPLRQLLPALEMMAALSRSAVRDGTGVAPAEDIAGPGLGVLGDFHILREVGRGGMGIVYEAEQLLLRRRVALKVLPFAAALDPRQLQRFKSEAQATALLHHTNIVPVHGVGAERGVHYYAMQFIDGRTLADVISELRRLEGKTRAGEAGDGEARKGEAPAELADARKGLLLESRLQAESGPADFGELSRAEAGTPTAPGRGSLDPAPGAGQDGRAGRGSLDPAHDERAGRGSPDPGLEGAGRGSPDPALRPTEVGYRRSGGDASIGGIEKSVWLSQPRL